MLFLFKALLRTLGAAAFNLVNYNKIKKIKYGDIYFRADPYVVERVEWRGWFKYALVHVRLYNTTMQLSLSLCDDLNIHTMLPPKFKQGQLVKYDLCSNGKTYLVTTVRPHKYYNFNINHYVYSWVYSVGCPRSLKLITEHLLVAAPNYNKYWAELNE